MDEQRLVGGLGLVLQRVGVPVYVHTSNDAELARRYQTHWGEWSVYGYAGAVESGDDGGCAGAGG